MRSEHLCALAVAASYEISRRRRRRWRWAPLCVRRLIYRRAQRRAAAILLASGADRARIAAAAASRSPQWALVALRLAGGDACRVVGAARAYARGGDASTLRVENIDRAMRRLARV